MSCKKIQIKNGWIFSPLQDVAIFVVLNIISIIILYIDDINSFNMSQLFIYHLIFNCFVGFGHLFATISPLSFSIKEKKIKGSYCLSITLITVVAIFYSMNFNRRAFLIFASFHYVFHFARQAIGFVKISGGGRIDNLMVYNICFMPFLIYLSNGSLIKKNIYLNVDLDFSTTFSNFHNFFIIAFASYSIFYIFVQIYLICKKKIINLAKYNLLLSHTLCSCISFLLFPQNFVFTISSTILHGLPYILLTYSLANKKIKIGSLKNGVFLFCLLILGLFMGELYNGRGSIALTIYWSIGITHAVMDSLIWRSKFRSM